MTSNFDYKKYSLENLEKWVSDALTSAEATPREIYDTIYDVVCEEFYHHKHHTSRCYDLMLLLNGNGNHIRDGVEAHGELWEKEDACMPPWGHSDLEYQVANQDKIISCDKDDESPECKSAWEDFWNDVDEKHNREYNLREAEYYNKRAELDAKQDKVVKWQLPVEVDGASGEYFVQFPDDLLEASSFKEGDTIQWVDQGDGSYLLKKV